MLDDGSLGQNVGTVFDQIGIQIYPYEGIYVVSFDKVHFLFDPTMSVTLAS